MSVDRVFIVGSGLMGSGIAQVCAQAGLSVVLHDEKPEAVEKALKSISWSVGKLVEKGSVAGPAEAVTARISSAGSLEAASNADMVIEAVFENPDLKREIFHKLDSAANPAAILWRVTQAQFPFPTWPLRRGGPTRWWACTRGSCPSHPAFGRAA